MSDLTTAEFREHQATELSDPALQRLIDAAEAAIVARFGTLAQLTERCRGGAPSIYLTRAAGAIASITERYGDPLGVSSVLLDATDYTKLPPGNIIRREWTGAHPSDRWNADAVVVYTPADDTAQRTVVTIALVQLDLSHNPGLSSEQVGDWAQTYANNSAMNYGAERTAIMDTLISGLGFA